ncbi:MAG: sigma-70 family RNA polymerase sigma factor [Saprospiraceae bacterium]|nr:sigma-70 family RNA polymerase sigma factor [Saprospiraceae bacterium]
MFIRTGQVMQSHQYWRIKNTELELLAHEVGTTVSGWIPTRSIVEQKRPSFIVWTTVFNTLNQLKNNFGLSPDKFDDLCSELRNGRQQIFENVFLAHFSECLGYLVRKYGVQRDDAYDATMDTLLDFRMRLLQGKVKYGNMRFLFTQMASQNLLRKIKGPKVTSIETFDLVEEGVDTLDEEDFVHLALAWDMLSEQCQELLQLYFYQDLKLKEVAEKLDKNAATIRKQKERCKDKLIHYFQEHNKSEYE